MCKIGPCQVDQVDVRTGAEKCAYECSTDPCLPSCEVSIREELSSPIRSTRPPTVAFSLEEQTSNSLNFSEELPELTCGQRREVTQPDMLEPMTHEISMHATARHFIQEMPLLCQASHN